MGTAELLARLQDIGWAVKNSGQGLAVLGLGSVGQELERLDKYSDLDFFVIARAGQKRYFLDSLDWLHSVAPVLFSFLNTADGYKLLFDDGIFCEMAVFEADELAGIPYSGARVVWQDAGSDLSFAPDNRLPTAPDQPPTVEWLVSEILSNLTVGLGRFRRGEKLTAFRFIQGYAVDRILELAPYIEDGQAGHSDPFDKDRRFEQRYPQMAAELPRFQPGYEKSPQAALAILNFIEQHFTVNGPMKEVILALCGRSGETSQS
jgi:lincosamide nucleotidyltransferase